MGTATLTRDGVCVGTCFAVNFAAYFGLAGAGILPKDIADDKK